MEFADLTLILLPALCAGVLVLATHVPLGYQVLKRGIIFIDLAIAQVAALGVVFAQLMHFEHYGAWATYLASAGFALVGAGLLAWLETRLKQELEAVIGCVYVVSAALALLLLSHDPHGAELIKQTLSGSILWVSWQDLWVHGLIYLSILLLTYLRPKLIESGWFYPLFAIAITSSVSLVGVYLVFASLVMPTLATWLLAPGPMRLLCGYGVGVVAYVIGLGLSAMLDWPSGATVVCSLACTGLIFRMISNILHQKKTAVVVD
ncbi:MULTISPECIES: metal ABC transporter permease [Corallincola]|uniref:Metal ABC transporter permease n=3 Tax=Corallincola TaxID=1775176 RepID=A0A368NQC6_9GAMM|nr:MULTISPECIES: metal ABC transporter permease [Corallincola]RCU51471.1 metal ABC transporter permease [Corallincola holothuriorum]TAA46971.1 metal ABC transporter permease [Corallincola spongiicola]TCI04627.1 metal ABC transporter permease [Corallincola luteus]